MHYDTNRAATPVISARIVGAVVLAVLVALPTSAFATSEVERAQATVAIEGNGFGHGRGLSQHGAQAAAKQGRTYRQILRFYYPGLSWGSAAGTVSVLLTGDTTSDVVVSARPKLKVRSLGSGKTYALNKRNAKQWRITPAGTRSTISFLTNRWRALRVVPGDAQFTAGGRPITLHTPAGKVAYRGSLRSASPAGGGTAVRDTVNVVALDDYLQGVVPREVPALWHPQAVRAQAVAARTYAAFERSRPLAGHYQICDTSLCQVYGGQSAEHPASNAAIVATAREVLTKGGEPAFTQFSASNGGWTSAGSFSYLPAQQDPYDRAYRGWRTSLDTDAIAAAYPALGSFRSIKVVQRDGNGRYGGRVEKLRITGSRTSIVANGDSFRSIFGLRSTLFQIS
ncbi:MAG: SpoIID/LytB domain-containing protein [Nocardioides sp.]